MWKVETATITGSSQPTTSKIKDTKWFVKKAKNIHGDKYDYTSTVYLGSAKKVDIVCPTHGQFSVFANSHISENRKAGCKFCGTKASTKEEFIAKAISKHGDKYTYTNVNYTNTTTKVTITCPIHGDFEQTPKSHVKGAGCSKCGDASSSEYKRKSTNVFIEEAKNRYGSLYTYNSTVYTGKDDNVTITCPMHGDFIKKAKVFLRGHGCPSCGKIAHNKTNLWSYSGWDQAGKVSHNFEAYSLYVIECSSISTGERFIKVGKTFTSIARRFSSDMPYKYKVLTQVYHNAYAISKLEDKIKAAFKTSGYLPQRQFNGMTECLNLAVKEAVITMAEA